MELTNIPEPPSIITGTNASVSPTHALNIVPAVVQAPKMALYISRLSTDTTKEKVEKTVKHFLGTDDVLVHCLWRKDTDLSTVTFLSFKVLIPASLRTKALNPATWPSGLPIREFVDRKNSKALPSFVMPSQTNYTPVTDMPITDEQPPECLNTTLIYPVL